MELKKLFDFHADKAHYEKHVKVKCGIDESKLLSLGAKKVGTFVHEDRYFVRKNSADDELVRIRDDGTERLLFTYKKPLREKRRLVVSKKLLPDEEKNIARAYKQVLKVTKIRTIYVLDSVLISVDRVDGIGDYIEFEIHQRNNKPDANEEKKIESLIKEFGLGEAYQTDESYYEILFNQKNNLSGIFLVLQEKIGELSFGITSGVLTTLGIIIGINTATESIVGVLGGIVSIAVADSLSDAFGLYSVKSSEKGTSSRAAVKAALNTLAGKVFFTMSFLVPFILFSLQTAVLAAVIWGAILLTIVGIHIAIVKQKNILLSVSRNLLLAGIVIALSFIAGKLIALIFA